MTTSPRYHVTAPTNWLNDPNGPLFWEGRWHVFFQHNPAAPVWGTPHWGHVSSPDLVRWDRHPVALAPTPGGPDRDGCWSGCARVVDGVPTVHYTGVAGTSDADRVEAVMRATADGSLDDWVKDPEPVIPGPPADAVTGVHRDPYTFEADGRGHLLLGTTTERDGRPIGGVHWYVDEGAGWAHVGLLVDAHEVPDEDAQPLWECPQLLRLDGGDLLVVSVAHPQGHESDRHVLAVAGAFGDDGFHPRATTRFDRGNLFYAPAAMQEPGGRWLVWGWVQDIEPVLDPDDPHQRVGALSLPREVELVEGAVVVRPAAELVGLRRDVEARADLALDAGDPVTVEVDLAQAEVAFTASGPGALDLLLGPTWDGSLRQIRVKTPDATADVRVFLDGDLVEVFTTAEAPWTTRVPDGCRALELVATAGDVAVTELVVASLRDDVVPDEVAGFGAGLGAS